MHCLWLSWTDPREGHGGELIYSSNLIHAFARSGAEIEVLCLAAAPEAAGIKVADGVTWRFVPPERRPAWRSILSPLPNVAHRTRTRGYADALRAQLDRGHWDCVVLDCLSAGWALPLLRADRASRRGRKPRIVYIAHNHEESLRRQVALSYQGNRARKLALLADASKAGALERKIVEAADLVTAITEEDRVRFAEQRASRPVIVLPPGYDGRRLRERHITSGTPRRAVVVGSFHWVAKQMNLEGFLKVADPMFAASAAQLHVVGGGDSALFERLRERTVATTVFGRVDSVWPHLDEARIAIVPEELGGGFKLKILDYVFNRLPVAAFRESVAGMPLQAPESVLTFSSFHELAAGVLKAIDDIKLLNRLQERAFAACAHRFDWSTRGTDLHNAVTAL
jgi:glycosyltransferase involved in cell wall biosynthesis